MFGRLLLVGGVWMVGGFSLILLSLSAEDPLPYYGATALLSALMATVGNYYAFYGFGARDEDRRPGGRIPLLRKLFFWMSSLMFVVLALQLPLNAIVGGNLPPLSLEALTLRSAAWVTIFMTSVVLVASSVFIWRWSKHAVPTSVAAALLLVATDALLYGFESRSFPIVAENQFPFWFSGLSLLPFVVLLILGRVGGDLR